MRQDLVADFEAYNIEIDSCHAEFNASTSSGDIANYLWVLDVDNEFGEGVIRKSGEIVQHFWVSSGCAKAKGVVTARLTVVGVDGIRESITKRVNVFGGRRLKTTSAPTLETSLTTHLIVLDRSDHAAAHVVLTGGRTQPVSAGTPRCTGIPEHSGATPSKACSWHRSTSQPYGASISLRARTSFPEACGSSPERQYRATAARSSSE